MKRAFPAAMAIGLVAAMAFSAFAKQESIAGTWTFRVPDLSLRLVLIQKGKKITGTLQNPHGNPIQLKGDFSDGRFTFTGESKGGEFEYQLSGSGILQSDGSLAGTLASNVGDMMWTAVRNP